MEQLSILNHSSSPKDKEIKYKTIDQNASIHQNKGKSSMPTLALPVGEGVGSQKKRGKRVGSLEASSGSGNSLAILGHPCKAK